LALPLSHDILVAVELVDELVAVAVETNDILVSMEAVTNPLEVSMEVVTVVAGGCQPHC